MNLKNIILKGRSQKYKRLNIICLCLHEVHEWPELIYAIRNQNSICLLGAWGLTRMVPCKLPGVDGHVLYFDWSVCSIFQIYWTVYLRSGHIIVYDIRLVQKLFFGGFCIVEICLVMLEYILNECYAWMWELDYKEALVPKNWCFWTVVLKKTLEGLLGCKKIKPVSA